MIPSDAGHIDADREERPLPGAAALVLGEARRDATILLGSPVDPHRRLRAAGIDLENAVLDGVLQLGALPPCRPPVPFARC